MKIIYGSAYHFIHTLFTQWICGLELQVSRCYIEGNMQCVRCNSIIVMYSSTNKLQTIMNYYCNAEDQREVLFHLRILTGFFMTQLDSGISV